MKILKFIFRPKIDLLLYVYERISRFLVKEQICFNNNTNRFFNNKAKFFNHYISFSLIFVVHSFKAYKLKKNPDIIF
jgi:hypothetical protein